MAFLVEISGMRTVHCVRAVFTALAGVDGVASADVSLGFARIEAAPTREGVSLALEPLGYTVTSMRAERSLPVRHEDD